MGRGRKGNRGAKARVVEDDNKYIDVSDVWFIVDV